MSINLDVLRWSLEELASVDEQRRLWLGRAKGEMSSFEEACCGVFDDSRLGLALERGGLRERYGAEVADRFERLSVLTGKVPLDLWPDEQIDLPVMAEIRSLAQAILASPMFSRE